MRNTGDNKTIGTPPDRDKGSTIAPYTTFQKVPVAVYKNPNEQVLRRLLRIALYIFAPLFFVVMVAMVLYFTLVSSSSETSVGTTTETTTMGDVPLPAGIRDINKNPDPSQSNLAENIISTAILNYRVTSTKTEIYASGKSPDDLNGYYSQKLKSLQWKQFNQNKLEIDYGQSGYVAPPGKTPAPTVDPKTKETSTFIIYYYTRPTKDPRVYEALFLRYENLLNDKQLKRRADLVGRKAEVGDTLIYISKLQLVQRD